MRIALSVDLLEEPKFRRTMRALGWDEARLLLALFELWRSTMRQRRDGILDGWTLEDIGHAAKAEEPEKFGKVMLAERWIDEVKRKRTGVKTYAVHDWLEHEPYAVKSLKDAEYKKRQKMRDESVTLPLRVRASQSQSQSQSQTQTQSHSQPPADGALARAEIVVWPYPVTSRDGKPSLMLYAGEVRGSELPADFERHPGREVAAGKSLRALLDRQHVSREEFAGMVKYHQTVVFPGGGGYGQTWNDFCEAAPRILGELRRGKTVTTKEIAEARKSDEWVARKEREREEEKHGKSEVC